MRMLNAFAAVAFLCLFTSPVAAQEKCANDKTFTSLMENAKPMVEAGLVDEMLVIQSDELARYISQLNSVFQMDIPTYLTKLVIIVRKDASAAIFGFVGECMEGQGTLEPRVHARVYGTSL